MRPIDSRITPVSSDYESCAECFVRLAVYTGDFDPNQIAEKLGITPASINLAGTQVANSRGRIREIKYSAWFLSSEDKVDSKDLREHIDWVVAQLLPVSEGLREVQNLVGVKMTLRCIWFSERGHGGPVLWPEQMAALAELDLECSFDIYFDGFG